MKLKKSCSSCTYFKDVDSMQLVQRSSKISRWICLTCLAKKSEGWYGKPKKEAETKG